MDQQTGEFTFIGESDMPLDDLAWNPVDGKMYGVNPFYYSVYYASMLYTIDLETAELTEVGPIIDDGPYDWNYMSGMGIDSAGTFYYYNNAGDIEDTEQGIYRSVTPGDGLEVELIHDMAEALDEPMHAFQVGPVFMDWSRDDLGYGAVRYDPTGATTHTIHYTFDDDTVTEVDRLPVVQGILKSVTRKPAQ